MYLSKQKWNIPQFVTFSNIENCNRYLDLMNMVKIKNLFGLQSKKI